MSASITIRNIDDETKQRLRVRAAEKGKSMEAEARDILKTAVFTPQPEAPPTPEGGTEYRSPVRGMWKELGMTTDEFMEMLRGD